MSPAEFVHLATAVCHLSFPPGVTPERLAVYAQVESRLNPAAIGPENRNGTRDYGLLQINSGNFRRFGVNARTIMQPCVNIRVGATILAEMDRRAACGFNTGRLGLGCSYAQRIVEAHARVVPAAPRPTASARRQPTPIPAASVYARRHGGRQLVYLLEK